MGYDELLQEGRIARVFRAKRKIGLVDLVSHVTQRAAGKEPLFVEDSDYLIMLALMKDVAAKRLLDVFSFCLMPNHVHVLLRPRGDVLKEAMRDLFSRYAGWFNRKYERKGHLFAGVYRQSICLDDSYLLAASLYIHMNPARAGLVEDPRDYRWSSLSLFLNPDAPSSFVKPGFVLGLLGRSNQERKETYERLLYKGVPRGGEDVLESPSGIGKLRKALSAAFPGIFKAIAGRSRVSQGGRTPLLDEAELDRRIEGLKGNSSRTSPETRQARRFLIEQLVARGYARSEIAARLGLSLKTIYNLLHSTPP